jgi:hypothetical protein
MIGIKFNKTSDGIGIRLTGMNKILNQLPDEALKKFRDLTPIRTGNARRSTRLQNRRTIKADYHYATDLDAGKSKQARQGMTRPFAAWLKNRADTLLKGR